MKHRLWLLLVLLLARNRNFLLDENQNSSAALRHLALSYFLILPFSIFFSFWTFSTTLALSLLLVPHLPLAASVLVFFQPGSLLFHILAQLTYLRTLGSRFLS